jgi:hypothetical protein
MKKETTTEATVRLKRFSRPAPRPSVFQLEIPADLLDAFGLPTHAPGSSRVIRCRRAA